MNFCSVVLDKDCVEEHQIQPFSLQPEPARFGPVQYKNTILHYHWTQELDTDKHDTQILMIGIFFDSNLKMMNLYIIKCKLKLLRATHPEVGIATKYP